MLNRNRTIAPLPSADITADLLRELIAEVKGLRSDLAASRQRPDRSGLLAAIAAAVAHCAVTAADVIARADVDPVLAAALEQGQCSTPKLLGRFLARCEHRPTGGVPVVRVGRDDGGVVWRIG